MAAIPFYRAWGRFFGVRTMYKQILTAAAIVALPLSAYAEVGHGHGHGHSDIVGHQEGTEIHIEGGETLIAGGQLFEAEFGTVDNGSGQYHTDDPGFEIEIPAGTLVQMEIVSPLQFHDGGETSAWGAAGAGSTLSIEDISFNLLNVTGTAAPGSFADIGLSAAGVTTEEGETIEGIHDHVEFLINIAATPGAYLLEAILHGFDGTGAGATELYTSDTFFIAFNYGLDDLVFEETVDSLGIVEAVPVPAAAWLFGSALIGLGAIRRKK